MCRTVSVNVGHSRINCRILFVRTLVAPNVNLQELVHLFGQWHGWSAGRKADEASWYMPVSDDTILRQLKRRVARLHAKTTVRVAGIDDWSWAKGSRLRDSSSSTWAALSVVDVLADRTTTGTAPMA